MRKKKARITQAERDKRALNAARELVGIDECERLRRTWDCLKSSTKSDKHYAMDGMIMNLAQLNLSNGLIRAIFGCGVSRIVRVRQVMSNPDLINRKRRTPTHTATENDLDNIKVHLATLDTEDSFPCAHRRP